MFLFAYFNTNILYSVQLFCTQWSFAINLFSKVLFQTFDYFSEYVPTMLLIWLRYCVDIFYIKFKFCKTFTVTNSVTRILSIKTLYKFRTIMCCLTLYLHTCFRLVCIQMFCISHLAFLRFIFHWHLYCSS